MMPTAAEWKAQLKATCAEQLRWEMGEKLQEERELQEIEEEERQEEEERWRREEEEIRRAEEARLAEEARIMEEMHWAAEEEERAAEEAWKAVPELGSWEEQIQALQLALVVWKVTTAKAAKSGSPNPGACYHCRNWKRECVRLR